VEDDNSGLHCLHWRRNEPVLLAEKDFEPWLSGSAGLELLKPAAEDLLQRWPVSKRVNSSRAPDDDPTLIERISVQ
jgi:putative SOS response-associated peptidase YedK